MGLNLDAVGTVSEPVERSWHSKDALLYALGVGAGALDPTGFELDLTTENSDGVTQRVLPTFTTIVGQGGGGRESIGDFDPAMLVHGEQAIRLHGEIPTEGTGPSRRRSPGCTTRGRQGSSCSRASRATPPPATGLHQPHGPVHPGAGGFGGPRNPEGDEESALAAEPLPGASPTRW